MQTTSWDEIASAAGVSRATMYRHYPDLASLVPACARAAFAAIDLPDRASIEREFESLRDPHDRFERLVRETCECYARGSEWLRAADRERDLVPELAAALARVRDGGRVLVDTLLPTVPAERRRVLAVLVDFPFWRHLRESGYAVDDVPDVILGLAGDLIPRRRTGT